MGVLQRVVAMSVAVRLVVSLGTGMVVLMVLVVVMAMRVNRCLVNMSVSVVSAEGDDQPHHQYHRRKEEAQAWSFAQQQKR